MEIKKIEIEISDLQSRLYELGMQSSMYSSGDILKLSQLLDEKIIQYQKLKLQNKMA